LLRCSWRGDETKRNEEEMDGGSSGDEKEEEAVTGTDERTHFRTATNSEMATAATKSRNYSHGSPNGSTREP